MIGNQYADIQVSQVRHQVLNIPNRNGVNASKRFIQQHKTGFCRQRARDFNSSSFATGKADGLCIDQVANMQFMK